MGSTLGSTDTSSLRDAETKLDKIISQSTELKSKYDELQKNHERALAAEASLADLRDKFAKLQKANETCMTEKKRLQELVDRASACLPTVTSLVDKIDGAYTLPIPPPPPTHLAPILGIKQRRPPPPPPRSYSSDEETESDACVSSDDELDPMQRSLML